MINSYYFLQMMQKTVKKSKREGSGKRLSYVVTESGLVENDDSLDESADQKRRDSVRVNNPRSLLGSINEIDEAKKKFKALSARRMSSIKMAKEAETKRKLSLLPKPKDPKEALAEINAAETERRRSSLTISDIAETKRRLSIAPKLKLKGKASDKNVEDECNDIGLIETDAMKKRIQQVGAALLISKALVTMSAPRRARKQLMRVVFITRRQFSL